MKRDEDVHAALPLKDAIRHQVASEKLSFGQLDELLAMQRDVLVEAPVKTSKLPLWFSAVAASCLLVVSLFIWQNANPQYSQEIALEVAENHLKLMPMDVKTQSMGDIRQYFTRINFSPVISSLMETEFALPEKMMIGGRYCSIKGVTATQLRFRGTDSQLRTFYEVGYDKARYGHIPDIDKGETPQDVMVKGLKVTLWVEKGLLMALVNDM